MELILWMTRKILEMINFGGESDLVVVLMVV